MNKNLILGLLACSLILNAFLAGYLVANHGRHFMPPSPLHRMEKAIDHLDPAYQDKVRAIVHDNQAQLDKEMKEMGNTFHDIHPILTAPHFDAQKLRELHKKLFAYDDKLKEGMLSMLIKIGEILPDKERITFFEEIKPEDHGPHGFGGPDGGPHGPPPPPEE